MLQEKFNKHIYPKLKFALSGSIATAVDYFLYIVLVGFLVPVVSNVISYSIAVIVNFVLQKTFIFDLRRKVASTFMMSIVFSIIGLGVSTLMIYWFNRANLFGSNQYLIKLVVTGIVFFYNFYSKRYAFERR